ncbi:uncharacterized protein LACBIDRAFT_333143 [Laccaria bicolor S238N-H82]|uniref:Predicted protein n=1 Tax=Laccaria bicolor (strain S238N-H82 / ATCC MYA-4686) TaxID=486041 RepID=B0DV16_LACBS|nr:uncharacterized protein LACBIDRAFT_333143 [Laccaria bicolor S238N-H82]EDR01639.1 predicted protein [Laccaria bicolor S238N-H82]|eukprot:XP_001887715.1 predicted protein [Laccaria bicolor S238N-H82]
MSGYYVCKRRQAQKRYLTQARSSAFERRIGEEEPFYAHCIEVVEERNVPSTESICVEIGRAASPRYRLQYPLQRVDVMYRRPLNAFGTSLCGDAEGCPRWGIEVVEERVDVVEEHCDVDVVEKRVNVYGERGLGSEPPKYAPFFTINNLQVVSLLNHLSRPEDVHEVGDNLG